MYEVYVLYSSKFDKLYIGFTTDLISRFHSHNRFAKKGFTIRYRPWVVVYVEFFDAKAMASARERELKSGQGRAWIRANFLAGFISA